MGFDLSRLARKIKGYGRLPWYMVASLFNSTFTSLTIFGTTFIFFLNDLGLDKSRIGALLALIPFAGLVAPFAANAVGRFGLRRTFVVFWMVRKIPVALILLVPFILDRFGYEAAFWWVAAMVLWFSLSRAIAETGFYPWLQELIPARIRGQFVAVSSILSTIGSMIAVSAASYVVDHMTGIGRYMLLLGVGTVIGLLGVASYAVLPGGAPVSTARGDAGRSAEMRQALRDGNFINFLLTLALISIGGSVGGTFVSLYANEQVGLSTGNVVLLSMGSSIGALIMSYPMGWAADRFGSRPMMVLGLALSVLMPLGWVVMPRNSPASFPMALALSFISTVVGMAWGTGSNRYLFTGAVPPDKKTGYMAVWYAWNAIIGGSGPLLAGWLLHLLHDLNGQILGFPIDAYTPLFFFNALTILIGVFLTSRVRDDEAVPLHEILIQLTPRRAMRRAYERAARRRAATAAQATPGKDDEPART
jgi:MFS family permease